MIGKVINTRFLQELSVMLKDKLYNDEGPCDTVESYQMVSGEDVVGGISYISFLVNTAQGNHYEIPLEDVLLHMQDNKSVLYRT